jgi:primary-amine oxidase
MALVDILQRKVLELIELPIEVSEFSSKDRKGDKVPSPENSNFDPTVVPEQFYSNGPQLNPIKIEQPLGPSFSMNGNHLKWRNFGMRIGYILNILEWLNYK